MASAPNPNAMPLTIIVSADLQTIPFTAIPLASAAALIEGEPATAAADG